MEHNNLLLAINELICSVIQIRFYYKSGDYVAVSDVYRLLSKCTSTPDLMLKKLLEMNIIGITENNGVVVVK